MPRPVAASLSALASRHRARVAAVARIDALLFPQQRAFCLDPSRLCAALCSRRAGKSVAASGKLYRRAVGEPGSNSLYVALTRGSAKAIMWDMLKRINKDAELGLSADDFKESELTIRLPNGSMIRLFGADANANQREKILGTAWSDIVVDEAASFRSDLRVLIRDYLRQSTADKLGRISLIGTPGDFVGPEDDRHLFYAVTSGDNGTRDPEPNWSVHRWNTLDNPHMREVWEQELAELPFAFKSTAAYKIMYLGEWAIDTSRRVYRHDPVHDLESLPDGDWQYGVGIDLGWDDPTAFVVAAWRASEPVLYIARAYSQKGMTLDDVAAEVARIRDCYPTSMLIVDGANKQAVETIRARYSLPLQAADKTGKADFIRAMNTDLEMGRVRLVRPETLTLRDEWATLVWDRAKSLPTELASCSNHCSDAALYLWRHARAYLGKAPSPRLSEEERIDALWERRQREAESEDAYA